MQAMGLNALLAAGALVLGLAAGAHALMYKRRPESAFGWIAVCLLIPYGGVLLYFCFGINRVSTRAKRFRAEAPQAASTNEAGPPSELLAFAELGSAVTEDSLRAGNRIEILHNGEQAFPAMLSAIEQARERVLLSTYIFETNATGRDFVAALGRAAARGADVRVLLDGIGEIYSWPRARRLLARAGVRHARFLPPRLLPPSLRINLRNHRKILAVDGATAFTGGINIGDRHLAARLSNPDRVVDMHFGLTGPIVADIERVFWRDWHFATSEPEPAQRIASPACGDTLCRAVPHGPDEDLDKLTAVLIGVLGLAKRRIAIMTPYFLPPREIAGALQAAALRGVAVDIVLPARNNLPYVHRATRHMLWELLKRGVKVYYQAAPFVHSKLLLIDGGYAQIGSANLDARSLRLNFELTVEIYDARFVAAAGRHFESVKRAAAPFTLQDADARPLRTRLVDGFAWLFSPYL